MKSKIILLLTFLLFSLNATALALPTGNTVAWDYLDSDTVAASVTEFLVCTDGQAKAICPTVPVTAGTVTVTGTQTYSFKFVGMIENSTHTVAIYACTVSAATCSTPLSAVFTYTNAITVPIVSNIRFTKVTGSL